MRLSFTGLMSICLLSILLVIASGCESSQRTRRAAITLAETGVEVARTGGRSIGQTRESLETFIATEYFLAGLTGSGEAAEPDQDLLDRIDRIQEILMTREEMFEDLALLYTSFRSLAAYDAAGNVRHAAGSLVDSINEYGQAVDRAQRPAEEPDPRITTGEKDLLVELAASAAAAAQAAAIRRQSQVVRQLLQQIIPIMEDEGDVYDSIDQVVAEQRAAAVAELWNAGIGRPHPILRRLLERSELEYDIAQVNRLLDTAQNAPAPADAGGARERLRGAVERYVRGVGMREASLRSSVIDQTVAAVTSLERQHRQLEARQPIDLSSVSADLAELRRYVKLLQAIAEERHAKDATTPEERPQQAGME